MKMRKRWAVILICLMASCVFGLAHAEDTTDLEKMLIENSWTCDEQTLLFTEDAGGTYQKAEELSFPIHWEIDADEITFTYEFYGEKHETLKLREQDGVLYLDAEDGSLSFANSEVEKEEASNLYAIQNGEEVNLGFVKFSLSSAESCGLIGDMVGRVPFEIPGAKFLCVTGELENLGKQEVVPQIYAEFLVNGELTYRAKTIQTIGGNVSESIKPMSSGKLYVYCEMEPEKIQQVDSLSVRLALNDGFAEMPISLDAGEFGFEFEAGSELVALAKQGPKLEPEYFDECPILKMPTSYMEINLTGQSSNSLNGKKTSIIYRFNTFPSSDDIEGMMQDYIAGLEKDGFIVKAKDGGYTIYDGKTLLSGLSCKNGDIVLDIKPGNEHLTVRQGKAAVSEEEPVEEKAFLLGDTVKKSSVEMTFDEMGNADRLYSSITSKASRYMYYETPSGNPFFYMLGKIKNLSSKPIDVRNIYTEFIFDDEYHYEGDIDGVKMNASDFIHDISPKTEVSYYVYADVPNEIINNFKTCVIRFGLTSDFGPKVISGNLPNFDYCDEVFEVQLQGKEADSKSADEADENVLKPGCVGPEVLDARTKLYQLGYFRSVPTQTEYTEGMMDFVKKFEKDYELTEDGLLSEKDLEVLDQAVKAEEEAEAAAVKEKYSEFETAVFAFEQADYVVNAKKSLTLKPILQGAEKPKNAKYVWSSSDEAVAKFANGKVTGVSSGTAVITCELQADGFTLCKAECNVEVRQPVTKIELEDDVILIQEGKKHQLKPKVLPEDAYCKDLIYSTDDKSIFLTSRGEVKGKLNDYAVVKIEATDGSGVKAEQKIKVLPFVIDTEEVTLSERGGYRVNLDLKDMTIYHVPSLKYSKEFIKLKNENDPFEMVYTYGRSSHPWFDLYPVKPGTTTITFYFDSFLSNPSENFKVKVHIEESACYTAKTFPPTRYDEILSLEEGKLISFKGKFVQKKYEMGEIIYEIAMKGDQEDIVIVKIPNPLKAEEEEELITGDKVTIYGAVDQAKNQITETGLTIKKPVVTAERINDMYYVENINQIEF